MTSRYNMWYEHQFKIIFSLSHNVSGSSLIFYEWCSTHIRHLILTNFVEVLFQILVSLFFDLALFLSQRRRDDLYTFYLFFK